MRVTYDSEVDSMYIEFSLAKPAKQSHIIFSPLNNAGIMCSSFNPYFIGFAIKSQGLQQLLQLYIYSFNPYFIGFAIKSQAWSAVTTSFRLVSILILLDLPLKAAGILLIPVSFFCFNPYFVGFAIKRM